MVQIIFSVPLWLFEICIRVTDEALLVEASWSGPENFVYSYIFISLKGHSFIESIYKTEF